MNVQTCFSFKLHFGKVNGETAKSQQTPGDLAILYVCGRIAGIGLYGKARRSAGNSKLRQTKSMCTYQKGVCERSDVCFIRIALRQSKWRDGKVATNARGPGYIIRLRPDCRYRPIRKSTSVGAKFKVETDKKYVYLSGRSV